MGKTALEKIKEAIDFEKQGGSYYVITKLCNIASKIFENDGEFKILLQTPFGMAKISINSNINSWVSGNPNEYISITQSIEKDDIKSILNNTKKILKYLSILDNENIKDIDGFNQSLTGDMTTSGKMVNQALTNFCGMLMFSEPYRFKDGGRSVRRDIKVSISKLENGNKNALSETFGLRGLNGEANAVYAHKEKYKKQKNPRKSTDIVFINENNKKNYEIGGQRQYLNQIENIRYNETKKSFDDNRKRLEQNSDMMSENKDHYNRIKITELPRFTRSDLKKALNGSTEKNGAKTRRQKRNEKENAKNYQNQKDTFYSLLSRSISKSSSKSPKNKIERSRNKNEKNRKTKQDQKITRNIRKIDVNKI